MKIFPALFTDWFFVTLQLSLMASILIVVVLTLQLSFRNRFSPYWHYALWLLFLVRLIVPWSPETSFSPYNWLPIHSWTALDTQVPAVEPLNRTLAGDLPPELASAEASPTPLDTVGTSEPYSPVSFALGVWLAGMFVFWSHAIYRYRRIAKHVGAANRIQDSTLVGPLEQCRTEMRVQRRVQLIDLPDFSGIALYGLWCPRIVASRKLLCSLTEAELRHVYMHELAHLKHHDILVSWICLMLLGIHWFNPVIWYGFFRMRLDREAASDYRVLQQLDGGLSYGRTLLSVYEKIRSPHALPGLVGIVESKSFLKRRMVMITQYTTHTYRYPLVGALLLALIGTVFLSGAQSEPEQVDVKEKYPYEIPIEMYHTSWSAFQPGDEIIVTELRGTSPRIEEGASYRVAGTYTLASRHDAILHVYATNGQTENDHQAPVVAKGDGTFVREFKLEKLGMLHMTYYPSGGGNGFGGIYFRTPAKAAGSPGATIDLAVTDADFRVIEYPEGGLHRMVVAIRNLGNSVSPHFDIYFYRDDPATTQPITHGGHDLHPDAVWSEGTMPIELKDGLNHFYVRIDPDNKIPESDETNNTAELKFQVKTVTKVVQEIERIN